MSGDPVARPSRVERLAPRPPRRARGQGIAALLVLAVVVAGGVALDRGLGRTAPAAARSGTAPTGAWLCPHGGGPTRWQAWIDLANPGADPVDARLTPMSARSPKAPRHVVVPPGADIRVPVPAKGRDASTFVETFGGWVAAGWVVQGGGGEVGVGAEPCAPAPARRWFASDGTTEQGQDAYVVVMNPFAVDAVIDVALFTKTRAPIRESSLTDLVLKPHRSRAIHLNPVALGERALGAEVDVSVGRVAVAGLGVGRDGGIRSVIGSTTLSPDLFLPTSGGTGQMIVALLNPEDREVRFGATLLSGGPQRPAGGLTESPQRPTSAASYSVPTDGPSSVDVVMQGGVGVAAAVRVGGVGNDSAATGGSISAAEAWVVLPAIAGEPARPRLVLVNPSGDDAVVTLHALIPRDETVVADIPVTVAAGSAVLAPAEFWATRPFAAILVTSPGTPVLAAAASTSLGVKGLSTYAVSMGVPIPGGPGTPASP
jgi:hypothetical protein